MSDNAEEGIARIQAAASRSQPGGLPRHQARNIAYLDERIVIFILALACIGLAIIWTSVTSPLVIYGSFAVVIALTILWGVVRIKRIEKARQERARQASEWKS